MIAGREFFDQSIKSDLRTCDNIRKIGTVQGDDCINNCFLYYPNFKEYCKLIGIDLSRQQKLNADHKSKTKSLFYWKFRTIWQ